MPDIPVSAKDYEAYEDAKVLLAAIREKSMWPGEPSDTFLLDLMRLRAELRQHLGSALYSTKEIPLKPADPSP